jgi:hypothetical protein
MILQSRYSSASGAVCTCSIALYTIASVHSVYSRATIIPVAVYTIAGVHKHMHELSSSLYIYTYDGSAYAVHVYTLRRVYICIHWQQKYSINM